MKSTPMLMSGPLVIPTLADLKTHSCRPMKPQPPDTVQSGFNLPKIKWPCPFGTVGDRLWIRETCRSLGTTWNEDESGIFGGSVQVEYRADGAVVQRERTAGMKALPQSRRKGATIRTVNTWTPSMNMPRWASRIDLEVTDVSVFRVQDITEETAKREGLPVNWGADDLTDWNPEEHGYLTPAGFFGEDTGDDCPECMCIWKGKLWAGVVYSAREAFNLWWVHIYGAESWAANPWVWGIGFKRVTL
jgi:hypothetical protein